MATKKSTSTSSKSSKTTKATKPAKSSKTTKPASAAKPASVKTSSHTASKPNKTSKPNKSNKNVIAYIVGAVAAAALLLIGIIALATSINNHGKNSLTVKDGDGNKITTEYLGFDDFNFRLKIPTSFHAMSTDDIVAKYGKNNAPKTVYANADDTVTIAITPTDSAISNDQVQTYLDTAKSVFTLGGEILGDKYYTQGNHNIATLEMLTNTSDGKAYNYMMFFSQDDKLTMITFTCKDAERKKWQPVGEFILKSIDFTK